MYWIAPYGAGPSSARHSHGKKVNNTFLWLHDVITIVYVLCAQAKIWNDIFAQEKKLVDYSPVRESPEIEIM